MFLLQHHKNSFKHRICKKSSFINHMKKVDIISSEIIASTFNVSFFQCFEVLFHLHYYRIIHMKLVQ